jgi:hypothetical protein
VEGHWTHSWQEQDEVLEDEGEDVVVGFGKECGGAGEDVEVGFGKECGGAGEDVEVGFGGKGARR